MLDSLKKNSPRTLFRPCRENRKPVRGCIRPSHRVSFEQHIRPGCVEYGRWYQIQLDSSVTGEFERTCLRCPEGCNGTKIHIFPHCKSGNLSSLRGCTASFISDLRSVSGGYLRGDTCQMAGLVFNSRCFLHGQHRPHKTRADPVKLPVGCKR